MASSLAPNATPADTMLRAEENGTRHTSSLPPNATPASTTLRAEENGIRHTTPLAPNATPANTTLRAKENGIKYASPLSLKATPADATQQEEVKKEKDLSEYLPLYKAVLKDNWDTAKGFLDGDPNAITAKITEYSETALQVAVGTRKPSQVLTKLLDLISPESLETLDITGNTVLHSAAKFGNIEAARILVARNPRLPNIWGRTTPIELAALYGHRDLTPYLFRVTKEEVDRPQKKEEDVDRNPFEGKPGVSLLNALIYSEFYDLALQLVKRSPELGILESPGTLETPESSGTTIEPFALGVIAGQCSAFPSGTKYKLWQWLIYSCVSVKSENKPAIPYVGDSENPCECCTEMDSWARFRFIQVCQKFHNMISSIVEILVPPIKNIKNTKQMHSQTLQIVKCLCTKIASLDHSTAATRFTSPVLCAAKLGISEVVEEILESFPSANWSLDEDSHFIFHLAVIHRREKVFNLLYKLSKHSRHLMWHKDNEKNTILHLAGKLAPPHRINLVSGAALQMQRELQWYKEVRTWVPPQFENIKNLEGKTPPVIFTEEHKALVKEGERWMKDTANSCSVAAALIATIAFAAAITVPGGTAGDSGFPIFSKEATLIVFTFSNAISLFSSTAALLMFLSITARYAEGDFLLTLPSRLIIGLITLFLSITSMMITFSATLYLVVGNKRSWALVAVAVSACLPVKLFVSLQFPLLLDMIRSTYRPRMFERNKGESGSRH